MKTKKNIINLNDDFEIDDLESSELTDEFFKNALSFSELPEDLQNILKGIENDKPKKQRKNQNLSASIL